MRIRPAALIIENNHVLFLRYDYAGGSKFALPGGNVDAGETRKGTREHVNLGDVALNVDTCRASCE